MKPSIILYKTLPDDLLHRLEAHFTVTQVPNLHPETVAQHAQAFASAQGLLGASETVNRALLEKMPALRAASTISVGYDNVEVDGRPYCPQNSPDAHACRFDGNRCRYGDGIDAGHCPPRGGRRRTG